MSAGAGIAAGRRARRVVTRGGATRVVTGDRGSGTVLLLGVVGAATLVAAVLSLLASAQVSHAAAQSAADLAALAGASVLRDAAMGLAPPVPACSVAADVVRRNGARLVRCEDEGAGVVRVEVGRAAAWESARAVARAGPSGGGR